MNLQDPNFGYRSQAGFAARMSRQELEPSSLGRARTAGEEVEYLELSIEEINREFPELKYKVPALEAQLANARAAETK